MQENVLSLARFRVFVPKLYIIIISSWFANVSKVSTLKLFLFSITYSWKSNYIFCIIYLNLLSSAFCGLLSICAQTLCSGFWGFDKNIKMQKRTIKWNVATAQSNKFSNLKKFKWNLIEIFYIYVYFTRLCCFFQFSFYLLFKIPKRKELNYSQRKRKFYFYDLGRSLKYISQMYGRCRQSIDNVNEYHQKGLRTW